MIHWGNVNKFFINIQFLLFYINTSTVGLSSAEKSNVDLLEDSNQYRIAGGQNVPIEEHPYQVYIGYQRYNHCGGAILNENTILTAAHCLASIKDNNHDLLIIKAGVTDLRKDRDNVQERKISRKIIHPSWDENRVLNDIAIVKLKEPFKFSPQVKSIKLPERSLDEIPVGTKAHTGGWGLTENGNFSTSLRYVEVYVTDKSKCSEEYEEYGSEITENMICAGRKDQGHPCNSDSGGPLIIRNSKNESILIGVLSFGADCKKSEKSRVYTKVKSYLNWIEGNLNL